jgi:hypothetical protein
MEKRFGGDSTMIHYTFKKVTRGDPATCSICHAPTYYSLTNTKTWEEYFSCKKCGGKISKIKRLRKYSTSKEKEKKSKISEGKNGDLDVKMETRTQ